MPACGAMSVSEERQGRPEGLPRGSGFTLREATPCAFKRRAGAPRSARSWRRESIGASDLGIKIEEGVERAEQLAFQLFFGFAFEKMHGDARLLAVLERDFRRADFREFFGRQQAHAVDERKFCHASIVAAASEGRGCDSIVRRC